MIDQHRIDCCIHNKIMQLLQDKAATSFSFCAIPMATPTAKISGRLSKTALPTLVHDHKQGMKHAFRRPGLFVNPYVSIVVAFVKELPIPRRSPATGRIAIGSIKLLPTRCKTLKILSFI